VRPPIDSQVDEHNLVKVEVFVGCNYIQLRECYIRVYKPTNTTVGPHLVQIGIGKFWEDETIPSGLESESFPDLDFTFWIQHVRNLGGVLSVAPTDQLFGQLFCGLSCRFWVQPRYEVMGFSALQGL
jgi:hypothetical protein